MKSFLRTWLASAIFALALSGCGGGGGGGNSGAEPAQNPPPGTGPKVTGTVSAPGGIVAFNGPSRSERMLALVFGGNVHAALSGTSPVAGAPVSLIEINASGAQVGAALATGTTAADGSFSITAPAGFVAGPQFVVRVTGSTGTLDAIVTTVTGLVVDPTTEAVKQLVLGSVQAGSGSTLAAVPLLSVVALQNSVDGKLSSITLPPAGSASAWATAIKNAVQIDPELNAQANALAASGMIKGRVTDASGAGLANIDVVALNINGSDIQARTVTDANGDYTLTVPPSTSPGYILSAWNLGTASSAASESYRAGGHGRWALEGDRVTVAAGTPTIRDLPLQSGTRLRGSVVADDTKSPLPGVRVTARATDANYMMVLNTRTRADGTYTLNVPVGVNLVLSAVNDTLQPYASMEYDGPATGSNTAVNGAISIFRGTMLAPQAGTTVTANFSLPVGRKVSGIVTVGPDTTAALVPNFLVRFFDYVGASMPGVRTDLTGNYRLWLPINSSAATAHGVRARGQFKPANLSAGDATVDFVAVVKTKSLTVTRDGTVPVGGVVVNVNHATTIEFEGFEVTRGDGSVTVFTTTPATQKKISLGVDSGMAGIGSSIYLSSGYATSFAGGTSVTFDDGSLGTVTLPPGATLSGKVLGPLPAGYPPVPGNYQVQARNSVAGAGDGFAYPRTNANGDYAVNVPAGTYRVRACPLPIVEANCTPYIATTVAVPGGAIRDFSFQPVLLSGTAAAGGPIVGFITVKDSLGAVRSVAIASDGKYSVNVYGMTPPFMLRAEGTVGTRSYTIHSAAVAADINGNVNVTPLTDLIVANVAAEVASTLYSSGSFSGLTPAALAQAEANLRTRLQPVLTTIGLDATTDLLRAVFNANHTGQDALLDVLRVTVDPVTVTATILNIINNQVILDDLRVQTDVSVVDATGVAAGLTDFQSILAKFDALAALFATSLPSPTSPALLALFDPAFLNAGNPLASFLANITQDPSSISLKFTDVTLDSYATNTAKVTFVAFAGTGAVLARNSWVVN